MTSYLQRAKEYIHIETKDWPENMPLGQRIRGLDKNRPAIVTSTARKAWQRARREYLERFGYIKRGTPESPMERMLRLSSKESD